MDGTERLAGMRQQLSESGNADDAVHEYTIEGLIERFGEDAPDGVRVVVASRVDMPDHGCLCCGVSADRLLREIEGGGRTVLGDLEAGIGVLSRMEKGSLDVVLVVANPTPKSIEVARRAVETAVAREIRVLVVANRVADDEDLEAISGVLGEHDIVVVPEDPVDRPRRRRGRSRRSTSTTPSPGVRAIVAISERLVAVRSRSERALAMQIAILLFDGVVALDAIGPYDVLKLMPGADVRLVAATAGEVATDGPLKLVADERSTRSPRPDLVVVPGGPGAHRGEPRRARAAWLRERARAHALHGIGVLGLGAARRGRPAATACGATSHWLVHDELADHGAIAVDERVVVERADRHVGRRVGRASTWRCGSSRCVAGDEVGPAHPAHPRVRARAALRGRRLAARTPPSSALRARGYALAQLSAGAGQSVLVAVCGWIIR